MKNPWLEISHSDYSGHMNSVGQAQILNRLVKESLDRYKPRSFGLIGCATGNGLEHIDPEVTKIVYGVDINGEYLEEMLSRFTPIIKDLRAVKGSIEDSSLAISEIDLLFVGLVLEYVDLQNSLKNLIGKRGDSGVIHIVIQKSDRVGFVSKTEYRSLEKLSSISKIVGEDQIQKIMDREGLSLIRREKIRVNDEKSFISLIYR